jgi:hypothetical protein
MSKMKKIHRQLARFYENDGCSICGEGFPHKGMTFGGVTKTGKVELVGECCVSKLTGVYAGGIYLHRQNIRRGN